MLSLDHSLRACEGCVKKKKNRHGAMEIAFGKRTELGQQRSPTVGLI